MELEPANTGFIISDLGGASHDGFETIAKPDVMVDLVATLTKDVVVVDIHICVDLCNC